MVIFVIFSYVGQSHHLAKVLFINEVLLENDWSHLMVCLIIAFLFNVCACKTLHGRSALNFQAKKLTLV